MNANDAYMVDLISKPGGCYLEPGMVYYICMSYGRWQSAIPDDTWSRIWRRYQTGQGITLTADETAAILARTEGRNDEARKLQPARLDPLAGGTPSGEGAASDPG